MPVMQETHVRFLYQEGPLEEGTVTHSSILAWRKNPPPKKKESQRQRSPVGYSPWGRKELDATEHAPRPTVNVSGAQKLFLATADSVTLKGVSATCTPYPEDSVLELAQHWDAWVSLSICLSLSHDPSSITSPPYTSGSLKEAGCKANIHAAKSQSCPTLCDPMDLARQDPLSMAGKNTGGGYHALLQGTFLTHEMNLGLLSCRQILYPLNYLRSPCKATVPQ